MRGFIALLTPADKLVLLLGTMLVIFSYVHFWQSSPAQFAIIQSPQQDKLIVDLTRNQTLHIQGQLGESLIEVNQGRIRFVASACTNKRCIQSGWHQHGGDLTACLPNRVSLQLSGDTTASNYDAIIF